MPHQNSGPWAFVVRVELLDGDRIDRMSIEDFAKPSKKFFDSLLECPRSRSPEDTGFDQSRLEARYFENAIAGDRKTGVQAHDA